MDLTKEIAKLLAEKEPHPVDADGFTILECAGRVSVFPVPIDAGTPDDAAEKGSRFRSMLKRYEKDNADVKCIIVPEDLWRSENGPMQARLLAQFGTFRRIFARNTQACRITRPEAAAFFDRCHTYGDAASRYRYGLFTKDGELVAASSFSSGRTWNKDGKSVRSYEWIRYASLPDTRVCGGMGKTLNAFIQDTAPDDIMSYSDMEWTDGTAYRRLGFKEDGARAPVIFSIDPNTWKRTALNRLERSADFQGKPAAGSLYHQNLGSVKFRLAVTKERGKTCGIPASYVILHCDEQT